MNYFQITITILVLSAIVGYHVIAIKIADDYVYTSKYFKEWLIKAGVLIYAWGSIVFVLNTNWETQVTTLAHGALFVSGAIVIGYMLVTFGFGGVLLLCLTTQTYGELLLFVYDSIFTKKILNKNNS